MLTSIREWVLGCIAATKIDKLERKLQSHLESRGRYLTRLSELERAASRLEGLLPSGKSRELLSAAKELFSLTLGVFGYGVAQEPEAAHFQKLDDAKRASLIPALQAMLSKVRYRCAIERLDREVENDLERDIATVRPSVTPDAVSVRDGKAKKTFPVDLTGWKYGDAAIWDALKATKSKLLAETGITRAELLNSLREQQTESRYGWRNITVILMDGEMAPPNATGGHWSPIARELVLYIPLVQAEDRILSTIYHEMTHVAQSILRESVTNVDYADFKSGVRLHVPGMPPKNISTPKHIQLQGPGVRSPNALETHALDDVEFFTDLKDAIDTAKVGLRDLDRRYRRQATREEQRIYIDWFVGVLPRWPASMGQIPPQQSPAFKAWRRDAPGKWKRGIKELFKLLD